MVIALWVAAVWLFSTLATTDIEKRSEPGDFFDVEGLAAHLGISVALVRKLIFQKRLPYHKVGRLVRIHRADVEAFLRAGRVESASTETSAG